MSTAVANNEVTAVVTAVATTVVNDNDKIEINITNIVAREDSKSETLEVSKSEALSEPANVAEEYVDRLYEDLVRIIGDEPLTMLNLASVLVNLMQIVERMHDLHGKEKKNLIIRVVDKYMDAHPSDGMSILIVAPMIDTMVSIDRGEMAIKIKPINCLLACLGICLTMDQQNKRHHRNDQRRKTKLQKRKDALERELAKLS